MQPKYLAVKIDVVDSRRAPDRSALQRQLFDAAEECNARLGEAVASHFVVTHGDEVQGLLHWQARTLLPDCLELWMDVLRPHRLRFGIGCGSLSTPLQPRAIGMDGEAWHRAKEAVDEAHRARKPLHIIGLPQGGRLGPDSDRIVTALGNLLLTRRADWTDRQLHAATLAQRFNTQHEAAKHMRVTPTTFSKHLSAAGWHEYREGRDAFSRLLWLADTPA